MGQRSFTDEFKETFEDLYELHGNISELVTELNSSSS